MFDLTEHRNMPIDDAVALIARNFDTYMRGEKNAPSTVSIASTAVAAERHPEAVQVSSSTTSLFHKILIHSSNRFFSTYLPTIDN